MPQPQGWSDCAAHVRQTKGTNIKVVEINAKEYWVIP